MSVMNKLLISLGSADLMPLWIILGLLGFFGLIVFIVIIVKKYVKPLQIKKDDIPEDVAVKQELDRILVPIEDEETLKQMDQEASKDDDATK